MSNDNSICGFEKKITIIVDFGLPNLTLQAEEETSYIGVWGQRRLNYLKHHRKVLYYNLLTSGKLHSHLADTEELKATDMLLWVQKMNNISNRAMEVVTAKIVFA